MEQKKAFDDLVKCDRCGGDACYKVEINPELSNYFCWGCGFNTNSICKVGSDFFKEQMAVLPDLYKDLSGEDDKGKVWLPAFVHNEVGMLYADGTGADNWAWAAVKIVPTTKEDGEILSKQKFKPDNSTKKYFPEKDFMEALSYLGLLPDGNKED